MTAYLITITVVAAVMTVCAVVVEWDRDRIAELLRTERQENARMRERILHPGETPLADVARMRVYGPRDPDAA